MMADRTMKAAFIGQTQFIAFEGCTNALCFTCLATIELANKSASEARSTFQRHVLRSCIDKKADIPQKDEITKKYPQLAYKDLVPGRLQPTTVPFYIEYPILADSWQSLPFNFMQKLGEIGMCVDLHKPEDKESNDKSDICIVCWEIKRKSSDLCHVCDLVTICAKATFPLGSRRLPSPIYFVDKVVMQRLLVAAQLFTVEYSPPPSLSGNLSRDYLGDPLATKKLDFTSPPPLSSPSLSSTSAIDIRSLGRIPVERSYTQLPASPLTVEVKQPRFGAKPIDSPFTFVEGNNYGRSQSGQLVCYPSPNVILGQSHKVIFVAEDDHKLFKPPEFTAPPQSQLNNMLMLDPQDQTNAVLQPLFGSKVPTHEKQLEFAEATAHCNMTKDTDVLLFNAIQQYYLSSDWSLHQLPHNARAEIYRFAAGDYLDDQGIKTYNPVSNPNSTYKDYSYMLLRVLKGVYNLQSVGFQILQKGFMHVYKSNAMQKPIKEWKVDGLVMALSELAAGLLRHDGYIIGDWLAPVCFRFAESSVEEDEALFADEEEMAFGEEEPYEYGEMRDNLPNEHKTIETISLPTIVKYLTVVLCFQRLSLANYLFNGTCSELPLGRFLNVNTFATTPHSSMSNAGLDTSPSNRTDTIKIQQDPLSELLRPLNHRNMNETILLLGKYRRLSISQPGSIATSVIFDTRNKNPIIRAAGVELDDTRFKLACQHELHKVKGAFFNLFQSLEMSNDFSPKQVWDSIFECKTSFPISVSKGGVPNVDIEDETTDWYRVHKAMEFICVSEQAHLGTKRNAFHDAILECIYFFSSCVFRPKDMMFLSLAVHDSNKLQGNIFAEERDGAVYLYFAGKNNKTGQTGVGHFPRWLSVLTMILCRIVSPFVLQSELLLELKELIRKRFNVPPDQAESNSDVMRSFDYYSKKIKFIGSTHLGVRMCLSPTFAERLRTGDKISQEGPGMLYRFRDSYITSLVSNSIGKNAFGIPTVNASQVRKIMTQFKSKIHLFLDSQVKSMPDDAKVRPAYKKAYSKIKEWETEVGSIELLGWVGHHHPQTELLHYNASSVIGNGNKIELYKVNASIVVAEGISIFFDVEPWKESEYIDTKEQSQVPYLKPRTIAEANRMEPLKAPPKFDKWICQEQEQAAQLIYTTNDSVMIRLPCGSGKTIAWAWPLSKTTASGVSIVILPFKQLCIDLAETLKKLDFEAITYRSSLKVSDIKSQVKFVLVQLESVTSIKFQEILHVLSGENRLNAFVLEECHNILAQVNFRFAFAQLRYLSIYHTRFIFVSGSFPKVFQNKVFYDFRILPNVVSDVYKRTTYGSDRIVVNLVPLRTAKIDIIGRLVNEIVRKHSNLPGNVLIFSPSKRLNEALSSRFVPGANYIVKTLTSESSEKQRQDFSAAFSQNKHPLVVGYATSAGSEGIDYLNLRRIIIVGGQWGGLIGLHQSISRAGRGKSCSEVLPEVFILHSRELLASEIGGEERVATGDHVALETFPVKHRIEASKFITQKSVELLVEKIERLQCVNLAIEESLHELPDVEGKRCEKCNYCLGEAWEYDSIFRGLNSQPPAARAVSSFSTEYRPPKRLALGHEPQSFNERLDFEQEADLDTSEDFADDDIQVIGVGDSINVDNIQDDLRIRADAMTMLHQLLSTNKCPFCDTEHPCKWKMCPFMQPYLKSSKCNFCGSNGHLYADIAKKIQDLKGNGDLQAKDKQFGDKVLSSCAIVITGCTAHNLHKACRDCTLSHDNPCPFKPLDGASERIRQIVMFSWLDTSVRKTIEETFREDFKQDFAKYWRWCVYQGRVIQNAWRVVYLGLPAMFSQRFIATRRVKRGSSGYSM
jgi:superfamily II DNA helicase RecQ